HPPAVLWETEADVLWVLSEELGTARIRQGPEGGWSKETAEDLDEQIPPGGRPLALRHRMFAPSVFDPEVSVTTTADQERSRMRARARQTNPRTTGSLRGRMISRLGCTAGIWSPDGASLGHIVNIRPASRAQHERGSRD